jgi:hypothetical protein
MLSEWHDFFIVIGAASGTLIGAMFVVVSIGSGIITRDRAAMGHLFVTATIIHLATVLFACAAVLIPSLSREGFGILFGGAGLAGLIYSGRNCIGILRRVKVERVDHVWYGFLPVAAYLTLCAAVALALAGRTEAIKTLAVALALLLVSGIRNAWDLILYFVTEQSAR